MKRAIELVPIENRYIELPSPNEPVRWYGQNIYERLVHDLLKTRDFAILVGADRPSELARSSLALSSVPADPCIINTRPIATSKIRIRIDELGFSTGSRADRTFYGFKRGAENPYNAGVDERSRNEFPVRKAPEPPGWFGAAFDDYGGLHDGKELGHEINFDVLFAGAKLKHQQYHATMGLDVVFENRHGATQRRSLMSEAKGFYLDLSAHLTYGGGDYSGSVMVARRAALLAAFNRTLDSVARTITDEISRLPLMTTLAARCSGAPYIAAGANFRVPVGQRFYDRSQLEAGRRPAVLVVEQVYQSSSRVRIEGDGWSLGDELVSLAPGEAVPQPAALGRASLALSEVQSLAQNLDAGNQNVDVPKELASFVESVFKRIWEGVKALVTLPYRIYRFMNYDQEFKGGELKQIDISRAIQLAHSSAAGRAIKLDRAFSECQGSGCLGLRQLIVAVVDSGVDYNHRELASNIFWDGVADTPGFDFFSNDPRPYDDHAHGTAVASMIVGGGSKLIGVAPNSTLMAVKAFSPYGLTTSSSIYSAFEYAIANGARVIVAGWATKTRSRALEDAVSLARANGVLVVAAAGDAGVDLEREGYYPAAYSGDYDNVIAVAGLDENGSLFRGGGGGSNYGRLVQLAAPAANINAASPRGNYKSLSHTGLSAGLVGGAATLVWSQCPKASYQLVKQALLEGAAYNEELRGEVEGNHALDVSRAMFKVRGLCQQ